MRNQDARQWAQQHQVQHDPVSHRAWVMAGKALLAGMAVGLAIGALAVGLLVAELRHRTAPASLAPIPDSYFHNGGTEHGR